MQFFYHILHAHGTHFGQTFAPWFCFMCYWYLALFYFCFVQFMFVYLVCLPHSLQMFTLVRLEKNPVRNLWITNIKAFVPNLCLRSGRCNECENWKILFGLWVIDVPRYVSYRTSRVRWLSVQQFDTLYRLPEHTFLQALIFYITQR